MLHTHSLSPSQNPYERTSCHGQRHPPLLQNDDGAQGATFDCNSQTHQQETTHNKVQIALQQDEEDPACHDREYELLARANHNLKQPLHQKRPLQKKSSELVYAELVHSSAKITQNSKDREEHVVYVTTRVQEKI